MEGIYPSAQQYPFPQIGNLATSPFNCQVSSHSLTQYYCSHVTGLMGEIWLSLKPWQYPLRKNDIMKPRIKNRFKFLLLICCGTLLAAISVHSACAQRGRSGGGFRGGGAQRAAGRRAVQGSGMSRPGAGRSGINQSRFNRQPIYRSGIHNGAVGFGGRPAYSRPPLIYGGHRYYAYNNYFYHPFRPYFWGPSWHPIGFFLGGLAAAAIIISIHNAHYHYYNGVFYEPYNGGYRVIGAPLGAVVPVLPPGYATLYVGGVTSYYYGGSYYAPYNGSYQVIAPPPGAVVYNLPDGCVSVNLGGVTYLRYNGTYYMPTQVNGQNAYEVVQVR